MSSFATENIHELAFQSNRLARTPLKLSNIEARIFTLCLGCLHQHEESLEVQVSIKDVLKVATGEGYDRVRDGCKGLNSNPISVETTEKDSGLRTFITTPLFVELRLEERTGILTGSFNEKLREHLLQLKQEFTKCQLQTLLTLKSAFAHRLYWILKSWEKPTGTVTIERQKLRDMLQGEEQPQSYPLWADFKRFVLEPAMKEIQTTDWPVSYSENKAGRTVKSVLFTIPIQQQEESSVGPKVKLTPDEAQIYQDWLRGKSEILLQQYFRMQLTYKLTEYQARKICDSIKSQEALNKLTKTLHDINLAQVNNVPMKSLASYSVNKLKEAFPGVFDKTK
jgi:plasmid replication initiation protein